VKSLGDVSIVVNMIGPQPGRNEQRVSYPSATDSWGRIFQLNLEVASHVALVACPLLVAHHRPPRNSSLFLFGSALIRFISTPNQTPWHAAKIAVNSLARGLFFQYRPQNVQVCCINPSLLSSLPPTEISDSIVHTHLVPKHCAVTSIDINAVPPPKAVKAVSSDRKPHVALIAGGSRGIGRGIAIEFAAQGVNVAVLGTNKDAIQQAVELCRGPQKGEVMGVMADVNDLAAVANAVQQVVDKWGRLSVLVYSAGTNRRRPALMFDAKTQDFKSSDPKVWGQLVDVNVKGAMNMTAHALPHLARHAVNYPATGPPTIIYISSAWVRQKGQVGQSTYVASKKAINGFADGMSLDLRPYGIKVTSLNAGLVNTDLGVKGRNDGVKTLAADEQIQPADLARTAWYCLQSQAAISEIDVETMKTEVPELDRAGKDSPASKL
jgi:3-oxoacyl-[acyl-carrier protein] reductase